MLSFGFVSLSDRRIRLHCYFEPSRGRGGYLAVSITAIELGRPQLNGTD